MEYIRALATSTSQIPFKWQKLQWWGIKWQLDKELATNLHSFASTFVQLATRIFGTLVQRMARIQTEEQLLLKRGIQEGETDLYLHLLIRSICWWAGALANWCTPVCSNESQQSRLKYRLRHKGWEDSCAEIKYENNKWLKMIDIDNSYNDDWL